MLQPLFGCHIQVNLSIISWYSCLILYEVCFFSSINLSDHCISLAVSYSSSYRFLKRVPTVLRIRVIIIRLQALISVSFQPSPLTQEETFQLPLLPLCSTQDPPKELINTHTYLLLDRTLFAGILNTPGNTAVFDLKVEQFFRGNLIIFFRRNCN